MKVKTLIFSFICDDSVKGTADKLRGFFADRFGEYTLIHQHLNENKLLYKAPLIQYKILDGKPFVLGINEGADLLQKIHEDIAYLKIGHSEYQIKEKSIVLKTDYFGTVNNDICYIFLTPWLALNEGNYEKYKKLTRWDRKRELLESILVGNILSISKNLGYTVPELIKVEIKNIKEVPTKLKGTPMLGFLGTFSVNFEIPDYWG
ncbi:CRISPR-associated endonuclease Cas6, partial [Caldisericum sp.]|uniref:CRISPR-associated endonuclease Cas6 n=1 Tax=Caldisericum sp. TaxID=2499687 RepID=UPI003D0EC3EE